VGKKQYAQNRPKNGENAHWEELGRQREKKF